MGAKQVGAGCEQSGLWARDRLAHIDKQFLEDLYNVQRKSTVEIARELGVPRGKLTERMDQLGIPRRLPGDAGAEKCRIWHFHRDFFERVDTYDKAYMLGF